MVYREKELAGDFQFIFTKDNVAPERIDGFTVFANVVEQDEYFVTVARYQNFGRLRISDITISTGEFEDSFLRIRSRSELANEGVLV